MLDRKKTFWEHYYQLFSLIENGNPALYSRIEKLPSIEYDDFIKKNFALANIPSKYDRFNELDEIKLQIIKREQNKPNFVKIEQYLENIDKAISDGIGLYISGDHGLGKTTLAVIVLKKAIKSFYKGFFCKSTEVVEFNRAGWKDFDKKEYFDYLIANTNLMVIDDIARIFNISDTERIDIDKIFTKRDDLNLATIITANHKLDDNRELFGDALYSNFKERLIEVSFLGDDYRDKINNNLLDRITQK